MSPDGGRYVLRDYVDAVSYSGLPPGPPEQRVHLPFQPQGEAITWTPDGSALLVAGERDDRLLRVAVPVASIGSDAGSVGPSVATPPATATAGSGAGGWTAAAVSGTSAGSTPDAAGIALAVGLVAVAGLVIAIAEAGRRRARGG